MRKDMGASLRDRAVVNGAASVSALRASVPSAGDVFTVAYPFIREHVSLFGEDGPYEAVKWRPGASYELCGPEGDVDILAHGEGQMVLSVQDVHKPGRFPTRVFFTRHFVDPDGNRFGKQGLKIMTVDAFKRRARGYRDDYDVEDCESLAAQANDAPQGGPDAS